MSQLQNLCKKDEKQTDICTTIMSEQNAITLVALVITIIIMLILAGVTISLTIGERGIFNTAQDAVEKQKIAEYKEKIELSRLQVGIDNMGVVTLENLTNQIYKDEIVAKGSITPINSEQLKMITKEGYVFIITADKVEYINKIDAIPIPPDLTEENVSFILDPEGWTNDKVNVTIEIKEQGKFTILYSEDETNWKEYKGAIEVKENKTIYVCLKNEIGAEGKCASREITKIDKEKPAIGTLTGSNYTSNSGVITATNITDIGESGIKGYYISMDNIEPTATSANWITLSSSDFTYNTAENGTYYVWVTDNAGNISDVKSCNVNGIVPKVSITAYNDITLVAGNRGTPTLTKTGTPKAITYSSSNTGIATINSNTGEVTAISSGTATMTVTITNYDNTTVSKNSTVTVQAAIAKVGNTNYANITNAISTIPSNGTVTLLANTSESINISAEKNITLNLNSKTLNGKIDNSGTLTINEGSIYNSDNAIYNNGSMYIYNVIMESSNGDTIVNNSMLYMNGGAIKHTGANSSGLAVLFSGVSKSYATTTLRNTSVTGILGENVCRITDISGGVKLSVYGFENMEQIRLPTWTAKKDEAGNDQDDLKWYIATKETTDNGFAWSYNVYKTNHNNEAGIYHSHVYSVLNGEETGRRAFMDYIVE